MFEVMKAHHHIGHLHAGVIDVVLHLHALAAGAHHAHERVAQRGVAQVPDVRRFIGVDVGVLDDDLAAAVAAGFGRCGMQQAKRVGAVETDIDVSVAGHFERRHARNRTDSATSSAAILRGACFNCLANWKAAGTASSPKSLCLGCSTATARSMP
jgi:hypothetical protein